ncbi:MAG TPA: carbamoyltransferase HypF [Candidatus Omnitrophica bacterium]|nr:carbamoyltransferase HypF [Candidatus Omnitrophota bacterium]
MKPTDAVEAGRSAARVRVVIHGTVQGVGFRPFIYRLATRHRLAGWVSNSSHGVVIEAEGAPDAVEQFLADLQQDKPPRASLQGMESTRLDPTGEDGFAIRASESSGNPATGILPDLATCRECLQDVLEPSNRRFRYPFTNCTNCGPRFSIIEALPYDRANTTMTRFAMCEACQAEYDDPLNRRFHAQPNACPRCGPHVELWDRNGKVLSHREDALQDTVEAIRDGAIVAVKGLGGFHLMVDARSEEAIRRLRARKHREEKPLALMVPSLDMAHASCEVSALEERLLGSPEAPIVLLRRIPQAAVARSVAPDNPSLGIMLPYTPLHHLLMDGLGSPVVATSGNRSDEPMCLDEREALVRLRDIADAWLVHDRPIARVLDDSVMRVVLGRPMMLRRARGAAPQPVAFCETSLDVLAVGGHLKTTVAVTVKGQVMLSQHLGDLDTPQAVTAFHHASTHLPKLYERTPGRIACDAHPDYQSTQFAHRLHRPLVHVQHHEAHVRACMAEHGLRPPMLGVAWDGTGYGCDGTVWGGEWLMVREDGCERLAHLRPFPLPGAEQAVREPRRAAIGVLYAMAGEAAWGWTDVAPVRLLSPQERAVFPTLMARRLHSPLTSSVGRLFDAVASLTGVQHRNHFEGQAAMALEFAADGAQTLEAYALRVEPCPREHAEPHAGEPWNIESLPGHLWVDWEPMVRVILDDLRRGVAVGVVAAKFHRGLAHAIREVAQRRGAAAVALGGGCFQNRLLLEHTVEGLTAVGILAYWPQRIPPNDGGLSVGQIMAAEAR